MPFTIFINPYAILTMGAPPRCTDETTFTLLWGGYASCNSGWDKLADGLDQCYKLYFLTGGNGHVELENQSLNCVLVEPTSSSATNSSGSHRPSLPRPKRVQQFKSSID